MLADAGKTICDLLCRRTSPMRWLGLVDRDRMASPRSADEKLLAGLRSARVVARERVWL